MILIKGMTMPGKNKCLTVMIMPDGTIVPAEGSEIIGHAVPVPPHGRLIDADAFERENEYFWNRDFINPKYEDTLADLINAAPTVIEAEGEEQ